MRKVINPLCPRCGKMLRSYGRINRRHLGNWLHGVCNCCGDCDDYPNLGGICEEDCTELEVTISGGTVCQCFSQCCVVGSESFRISSPARSFNGIYRLPFDSETSGVCTYKLDIPFDWIAQKYSNTICSGDSTERRSRLYEVKASVVKSTQIVTVTIKLLDDYEVTIFNSVGAFDTSIANTVDDCTTQVGPWVGGSSVTCCRLPNCGTDSLFFSGNGFNSDFTGQPDIHCCWNKFTSNITATMPTIKTAGCVSNYASLCTGTHELTVKNGIFMSEVLGQGLIRIEGDGTPVFADVTKQVRFGHFNIFRGGTRIDIAGEVSLLCVADTLSRGAKWLGSGFDCTGSTSSPYSANSDCYSSVSGFSFSVTENTCCFDDTGCVEGAPSDDGTCPGI